MRRLFNVALRGLTLICKFLLIFFLAKFLDPKEVGLYGLMAATIGYALYLLGFEFYMYSTREIIKKGRTEWGTILKGQLLFTGIMYLIWIPVFMILFGTQVLPAQFAFWFFTILILEHFALEFNRILIAMSAPLAASLVLFARSGAWILILLMIMSRNIEARQLTTVFFYWSLGGLLACLTSIYYILKLRPHGWNRPLNYHWLRKGFYIAAPFFLSAIAIRGIFTIDRYWLEYLTDLETVAVYVLFVGIGNALISFLDAGLFVFTYPELIDAHEKKDADRFRSRIWKLTWQVFGFSLTFCILALVLLHPLLEILGKPLYTENEWMFPWILLAIVLFSASMVPQYGLYSQGMDVEIIMSNLLSFLVFLMATYLISISFPKWAVIISLCTAMFANLVWCTVMFIKKSPRNYLISPH